jgi:eukaryotic-like serine/threonine-protein kinase
VERWRKIDDIFQNALERPASERLRFVAQTCAEDTSLRREIEALLQAHERNGSFLESPPRPAASSLVGRTLGPYEIKSLLGVGGMGAVYRAWDSRLKRDVAVKALPDEFSTAPQRVARFRRESEILASLNHPHIAGIHDVVESGNSRFLVLELVEGDTLADRIEHGPLPLDECVRIAGQIAEGLEAAHAKGIVHRDLKPANVKLTREGKVKILDFGLATTRDAQQAVLPAAPTISPTETGLILGTPAYMSPEQARGEETDRRTDVWSFGCLLFEMLTGSRLFEGKTTTEVIAGVLKSPPQWERLPANTPQNVRRLMRRCLQKNSNERLRDIGDARLELLEADAEPHNGIPVVRASRRTALTWIIFASAFIGAALVIGSLGRKDLPETRLDIAMPEAPTSEFAISSDGTKVAYVAYANGVPRLWVRPTDTDSATFLPGTEFASFPFWSPDGRSIGFSSENRLGVIDMNGGEPRFLAPSSFNGGTWGPDDTILFTQNGLIHSIPSKGGQATPVSHKVGEEPVHVYPVLLPDHKHFLFWMPSANGQRSGIYVGTLGERAEKRLMDSDTRVVFVSGYLVFGRQRTLFAQAIDSDKLTLRGDPFPIAEGIDGGFGPIGLTASSSGTIGYRKELASLKRQFVWFGRAGNQLEAVGPQVSAFAGSPSMDGQRLFFSEALDGNTDVWTLDLKRGTLDPFTSHDAVDSYPVVSPDGVSVAYGSRRSGKTFGVYRSPAGNALKADFLLDKAIPSDWSRDSRKLLCMFGGNGGTEFWVVPFDEKGAAGKPYAVLVNSDEKQNPHFSPDGNWMVYQAKRSERWEIYARPLLDPESADVRISDSGGRQPRWSDDGKEIFYVARDGKLTAVPVELSPKGLIVNKPIPLFDSKTGFFDLINRDFYVPSADGKKFLVAIIVPGPSPPLTLLMNWQGKPLTTRK